MNKSLQGILSQQAIIVKQEVELSNILVGIDNSNKYALYAPGGQKLGQSAESSGGVGGFILRQILNNARSAEIKLFSNEGEELAHIRKPLKIFYPEIFAYVDGQVVGMAKRTSWFGRNYTIGVKGVPQFTISSSLFQWKNFRFEVKRGGVTVATIMKRYEGALKMMFTQADTFTIEFHDANLSLDERMALLATTFLIDYDCFEQR